MPKHPKAKRRLKFGFGISGFLLAVAIGVDQLGNALTGGDPDMTISTRCGYELRVDEPGKVCRFVCWALDKVDPGHCANAKE